MKEQTRMPATSSMSTRQNVAASPPREIEHNGFIWLDIINPSTAQVAQLRERFAFESLALEDVLSPTQRPKLDSSSQNQYLFLILQFPHLDKDDHITSSDEIHLFVGSNYIVSIHDGTSKPLRRLFTAASSDEHARAQLMGRGPGYLLYRISDALVKHTFPVVDQLDQSLVEAEEMIFGNEPQLALRNLTLARRDVAAFRHIVAPNATVFRGLITTQGPFQRLPARYFQNVAEGVETLVEVSQEQEETTHTLHAALDSVLQQQMNTSLRFITVLLVVVLPILVIAAILGMNLTLPVAQEPWLFPSVIILMLLVSSAMVFVARRKQWF
jgi:magnesium transporter